MHVPSAILAGLIMLAVIVAMERGPRGPVSRPALVDNRNAPLPKDPGQGVGYASDLVAVSLRVVSGRLMVSTDVYLPTEFGTFGVHISPRKTRWLYVVLGNETRTYELNGRLKIEIPNSLDDQAVFEWGEDYIVIRIDNPQDLRFPDIR